MTQSYTSKPRKHADVFWAEMPACDHCMQIYDDDAAFLDALESYAESALKLDEAIIIIATDAHVESLASRLVQAGVDLPLAIARDQFVSERQCASCAVDLHAGWNSG